MAIELRELRGTDLFPILTILGKLEIKDDFVALFSADNKKKVAPQDHQKKKPTKKELEELEKEREAEIERRGVEIVADLIQRVLLNAGKVENELNSLLASVSNKSKKEVDEMSLEEYAELVVAFFKKPELLDFIKRLASFTK